MKSWDRAIESKLPPRRYSRRVKKKLFGEQNVVPDQEKFLLDRAGCVAKEHIFDMFRAAETQWDGVH